MYNSMRFAEFLKYGWYALNGREINKPRVLQGKLHRAFQGQVTIYSCSRCPKGLLMLRATWDGNCSKLLKFFLIRHKPTFLLSNFITLSIAKYLPPYLSLTILWGFLSLSLFFVIINTQNKPTISILSYLWSLQLSEVSGSQRKRRNLQMYQIPRI